VAFALGIRARFDSTCTHHQQIAALARSQPAWQILNAQHPRGNRDTINVLGHAKIK